MAKKLTKWQAINAATGAIRARDALKQMLHNATSKRRNDLAKSISADLARMEMFITANGLERYAHRP